MQESGGGRGQGARIGGKSGRSRNQAPTSRCKARTLVPTLCSAKDRVDLLVFAFLGLFVAGEANYTVRNLALESEKRERLRCGKKRLVSRKREKHVDMKTENGEKDRAARAVKMAARGVKVEVARDVDSEREEEESSWC
jgi:hypothetical protein